MALRPERVSVRCSRLQLVRVELHGPSVAVLSVVGVVVALSSAAAMKTSDVAIRKLAGAIQPFDHGEEPPVMALRSADLVKEVKLGKYINLLYPWRIVPWFLVAAWVAVFAIRLTAGSERHRRATSARPTHQFSSAEGGPARGHDS